MLQTKNNNLDGVIPMNIFQGREFDETLGKRLKLLRQSRRMSMDNLGGCIGVCGQQIHKYETGESRMPPERLAACARMFGVPVGYFFGEGESGPQRRFDKSVVTVAAEVHELPSDVRQGFYSLMRLVNKMQSREEAAEENKSNSAKAA
ncbi:MAG: XRE family transcriptional regulator [Verrucomicrobiae bacterium]|nr:XRE family transcriptional regulator [Verrucomicrobiae bacterium]